MDDLGKSGVVSNLSEDISEMLHAIKNPTLMHNGQLSREAHISCEESGIVVYL